MVILNRLRTENFYHSITDITKTEDKNTFLIFSNNTGNIYGLWFFSIDDISSFKDIVSKLPSKKVAINNISIMDKLISAKISKPTPKKVYSNPLNIIFDRIDSARVNNDIHKFITAINSTLKDDESLATSLREQFIIYKSSN